MKIFSIAAVVLACLTAPSYAASILYDQTPPDPDPNGFSMTDTRIADDFTLAGPSTLTDVLFFFKFGFGGTMDDLGAVTYAIYHNAGGTPGTLVQTATIASGSVTRTDQNALCTTCASATFSIATLNLAAGIYWLELHADSSLTGNNGGFPIDWAAVADNATLKAQWDTGLGGTPNTPINAPGFDQYAFQLSGTTETVSTVPEPGTASLLALGAAVWFYRARRRRAQRG